MVDDNGKNTFSELRFPPKTVEYFRKLGTLDAKLKTRLATPQFAAISARNEPGVKEALQWVHNVQQLVNDFPTYQEFLAQRGVKVRLRRLEGPDGPAPKNDPVRPEPEEAITDESPLAVDERSFPRLATYVEAYTIIRANPSLQLKQLANKTRDALKRRDVQLKETVIENYVRKIWRKYRKPLK